MVASVVKLLVEGDVDAMKRSRSSIRAALMVEVDHSMDAQVSGDHAAAVVLEGRRIRTVGEK